VLLIDVPLEKRPVGRIPVDVTFFDVDPLLRQKTSGVAAGRSRGFPEEDRLRHRVILGQLPTPNSQGRKPYNRSSVDGQRDLSLDTGGVDPGRAAMRVRAPDGL
jgi:hypothetical protein